MELSSFQGLTWLGSWSVVCWKIPSSSRSFLTECADRWKLSSLPPGGPHSAPSPVPPLDLWRDYRETLWIQDLRSTNGGGKRFLCSDALAPDHTGFCPWKIFENLWSKNIFNMSCVLNVKLCPCAGLARATSSIWKRHGAWLQWTWWEVQSFPFRVPPF